MKDILKKMTIIVFVIALVFLSGINVSASPNEITNTTEITQNNNDDESKNIGETEKLTEESQKDEQNVDKDDQTQKDEPTIDDEKNQSDDQTQGDKKEKTTDNKITQNRATDLSLAEKLDNEELILVNVSRKFMLTATKTSDNLDALNGIDVSNINYTLLDNGYYTGTTPNKDLVNSCVKWKFEKVEGTSNQYYISTMINNQKKYLTIESNSEGIDKKTGSVTLSDNKDENSKITVDEGSGNFAGQVRLTNKDKMAINLYDSKTYFSGWYGTNIAVDANNYFYLVSKIELQQTDIVKNTVTPAGTVINLFDYWLDGRTNNDYNDKIYTGINKEHALKFRSLFTKNDTSGSKVDMNGYVGKGKKTYPGIVKNTLENGYPYLTSDKIELLNSTDYANETYTPESLNYLFDPSISNDYKKTFKNVGGLLQLNKEGYYYYDCTKNFAEFDEENKHFKLYNQPGITQNNNSSNIGQFFPFNKFEDSAFNSSTSSEINHYFGMTLTSRFIQQYNGFTDATQQNATEFEFSGDDDVWIFIDGILVADLGGIHDAASVSINFATGDVTINGTKSTTLIDQFKKAGSINEKDWNGNIFANNTYHTLKFFYLERGNYDSNMTLKYNLQNYPPLGIFKVDQRGNKLAGAKFAVYASNEKYNYKKDLNSDSTVNLNSINYHYDENGNICNEDNTILVNALYCGTTNSDGEMVFVDQDNMPYSMKEITNMFGEYFILKEIECPKGYRFSNTDIQMRIRSNALTCNNSYQTGVYASPTIQMVAPNTLRLHKEYDGSKTVDYYHYDDKTDNIVVEGTLFAVVLKYNKKGDTAQLSNIENWAPVYGKAQDGYTVVNVKDYNGNSTDEKFISAAIAAAKHDDYNGKNIFTMAASGQMEASMSDLPGRIWYYYWMINSGDKKFENAEYTVAYYWTPVDSLADANYNNTYRVDDKYKNSDGSDNYEIIRTFGANIEVPNLLNRVLVQKIDENNNLVNDATFAMYEVDESDDKKIYYKDKNNNYISLEASEKDFNKGTAKLKDSDSTVGNYEVDDSTGNITVKVSNKTYTIEPIETQITYAKENKNNASGEDGTATFSKMDPGKYYIREIHAPDGYRLNSSEIMVYVTNNAIYANAGTANDGVVVGRGPGYLVNSLHRFASIGDINNTLAWVYSVLKISNESTSFDDVKNDNYYEKWRYTKANFINSFNENTTTDTVNTALTSYLKFAKGEAATIFNYDTNKERNKLQNEQNIIAQSRRLSTDIGWSYLEIYQDYDYGLTQKQSAHYDNLKYKDNSNQVLYDISHLFSRSVYVRVSDQPEKLKIKKVDQTNHELTLLNAKFKLKRVANNTTYYAKVTDGNIEWVTNENDKTTLTTNNDGIISIKSGLYDGEYTLTETKAPEEYVMYNDKKKEIQEKETNFTIKHGVISGIDIDIEKTNNEITAIMTIENTPKEDFEFTKVNKEGEVLTDAEFQLYEFICDKTNEEHTSNHNNLIELDSTSNITGTLKDCYKKVDTQTSSNEGKVIFTKKLILNKKYRLIESKTPDGYADPGGQWEICISLNDKGQSVVTITAIGHTPAFKLDNQGHYSLINYTPAELPLSGYSGIIPVIITGSIIIIIAILWYIRKYLVRTQRT